MKSLQPAPPLSRIRQRERRHETIRSILNGSSVASQEELRRKLAAQGFQVTQATLSRDVHDLNLSKNKAGYVISVQSGTESRSDLRELFRGFGLQVRQALNLLVLVTTAGSAQPVAAGVDRQDWPEVMGTIAGDDTVLVICPDERQARSVRLRIEGHLA